MEKPIADPKSKILELISGATTVAAAAHKNPDGDAVGSTLGVAEILSAAGKRALIIPQKNAPRKYSFLVGWDAFSGTRAPPAPVDVIVCLDAGDVDRLPEEAQDLISAGTPAVNIDHHRSNPGFGTVNWVDPQAASTSLLVYLLFKNSGYKINRAAAEALYVGLVTDTGGFSYGNTDPQAFFTASELVELGVRPSEIDRRLTGGSDTGVFHLFGAVLGTMARAGRGDIIYMYVSQDMLGATGADVSNTEGLVDYTRRVMGMRLGIFFREMEDGDVQVSFRSGNGLNVRLLAESLGGGGHNEAAGCRIRGPLNEAIRSMLTRCERWLDETD